MDDITTRDAKERHADHQRPQAELEAAAGGGIGGHAPHHTRYEESGTEERD
jgi:hypothetical protein